MILLERLESLRAKLEAAYKHRGHITHKEFQELEDLDRRAHLENANGFSDYIHLSVEWDQKHRLAFLAHWGNRVNIETERRAA